MPSLNNIADTVAHELKQWDNYELKQRIKLKAKLKRAVFIRRDSERNSVSSQYLQRFRAELIQVDKLDNCVVQDGCIILRTKNLMPTTIRLNNYSDSKFVGDLEGNTWTETELEELKYTKYNRFTANVIRFARINGYRYIFNNRLVKWIVEEAAWENPEAAINFCDNTTCYTDDMEFPCGADLIDLIITEILKEELEVFGSVNRQQLQQQDNNQNAAAV